MELLIRSSWFLQIVVGKVRIGKTDKPFDVESHFSRVLKGPVPRDSGDLPHANFVNQILFTLWGLTVPKKLTLIILKIILHKFLIHLFKVQNLLGSKIVIYKESWLSEWSVRSFREMIASIHKSLQQSLELLKTLQCALGMKNIMNYKRIYLFNHYRQISAHASLLHT